MKSDRYSCSQDVEETFQHVTDGNAASTALAFDHILNALWEMLSGVCRRHAIAC